MINFVALWFGLVSHYLGDMAWQKPEIAHGKSKRWYLMLTHVMVWAGTISVALYVFGLFAFWKVIFLVVGHFLIDEWKSKQPKDDAHWYQIYIDQGLHIIQIIIVFIL
jgi:hypothetical protein